MQQSEDQTLVSVLENNDIPPDIIQNFISNGITLDLFKHLSEEHLKELCPNIAMRIKISEIITAYAKTETVSIDKSQQSQQFEIISLDDLEISQIFVPPKTPEVRKTFPDFDLNTLLQTSPGGNSILNYYKTNGLLNNSKRNQLTDIIIKHIYTYIVNCRLTYEEYNVIAAKIITLFPKESIGTYFTKPIKKNNSVNGRSTVARGKLVDKVRNLLHKYGDSRKRSHGIDENVPPLKKTNIEDLENLHSSDVLWLNCNTEPWDEVIHKWKATYDVRKEANFDSVHDFLQNWKILSDPRSESLINLDFDNLYPEKGLNLYLNWQSNYEKIVGLKPTTDEKILDLMQSLENINEDFKLPTQLKILAHLLPPKGRLSKKIKFTTLEAIESFFVCVPNPGDIDNVIKEQKKKALTKKLSVQPYVIIQGSLTACSSSLLIVDDVQYQFRSLMKAFDTLFKVYHVFNARYPKAGEHLYLLIQRNVYKIVTKYDNVVSYINDVLDTKNVIELQK